MDRPRRDSIWCVARDREREAPAEPAAPPAPGVAGASPSRIRTPHFAIRNFVAVSTIVGLSMLIFLSGCMGKASKVNVELRKQKQNMESRIAELERQRRADRARIDGLEAQRPTVATLPQARLDELVTVHGIEIGRLTGGIDLDPEVEGDEILKVYLLPVDEVGDCIKAAGAVVVEAFDLALPEGQRIGRWEFTATEVRRSWYSLVVHQFVLSCPWKIAPRHPQITLRVTFTDELTGRTFTEQKQVIVNPSAGAAASRPATQPASQAQP